MLKSPKNLGVIHFIGIGGIGMSGIAEILFQSGYNVQGSDISNSNNTIRLRKIGIKIFRLNPICTVPLRTTRSPLFNFFPICLQILIKFLLSTIFFFISEPTHIT